MQPKDRTWLADLPMLAAACFIAVLFGRTFAGRVTYPFDLEWMEGGMLLHALRVLEGKGLYVEPSVEFIPYIYPPLYPWVVAAISWVTGLSYAVGRSVSAAGTVLAALALVAAVRQEKGHWLLGLGAAGLYLSCYENTGAFFDLVRADGLVMALLTWSLVAVRGRRVRTGGLLLALAFVAKHNAALFGLPCIWWLWRNGKLAGRYALWSIGPALAFVVGMQFEGDGLFLTYILGVPASHPYVGARFFPGAPMEMLTALQWTSGVAAIAAIGLWVSQRAGWIERIRDKELTRGRGYWVANGALAILLGMVMRSHHGGFTNVLMPGDWTLALWAVLVLASIRRHWPGWPARLVTASLVAWQIWDGAWIPSRYLPTAEDRRAGEELVAELAAIDGEVLAPHTPYYPVMAGKRPYLALIALWDIDHEGGVLRDRTDVLDQALKQHQWAALLLADDRLAHGMRDHYEKGRRMLRGGQTLKPKTGWPVRPEWLWTPKTEGSKSKIEGNKHKAEGTEPKGDGRR